MSRRTGLAAALLSLIAGSARAAEPPAAPWQGSARAEWVRAAAERAFVLGKPQLDLRQLPELFAAPVPPIFYIRQEALPPDAAQELHVVASHRQPAPIIADDGRVTIVPVTVTVGPTARPVILVLTASESVLWQVVAGDGARIDAVYLGCLKRCEVRLPAAGVPAAQPMPNWPDDPGRPGVYSYGDGEDDALVLQMVGDILARPVVSAQVDNDSGAFHVPMVRDPAVLDAVVGARDVAEGGHMAVLREPLLLVVDGAIVRREGNRDTVLARPPHRLRAVTAGGTAEDYYGLGLGELMRVNISSGQATLLEPPAELAPLDWRGGIAYDERSHRVVIVGSHAHHLYAPATDSWEVVPAERTGGALMAVAYSPALHRLYALRRAAGATQLVALDPTLQVAATVPLSPAVQPATTPAAAQMVAVGDGLAICRPGETGGGLACMLVEPSSGTVQRLDMGTQQ